jgi:hypothetical protein
MPGRYIADTSTYCFNTTITEEMAYFGDTYYTFNGTLYSSLTFLGSATSTSTTSDLVLNTFYLGDGVSFTVDSLEPGVPQTIQIVTDGSDLAYTATLMSGTTILGSASLSGSGTFSLSFNPTITTATLTIEPTFGSHHSSSAHFINLQGIYLPRYNAGSMNVVSQVCDEDHYHYGYNGQMKVNEWAGVGNHNTALFWEYDTRTGRRANQDPKGDIWQSPYIAFGDNPIENVDPLGDKVFHYNAVKDANGNTTLQLASVETVYKNVIVGYTYNIHAPTGRYPIYQTVEDTKDRYVVATQKYVYTDAGTGNRRVDYTTESAYDSYDEAYANRDHPNDQAGPIMVGLASVAHAHRMGEAPGAVRSSAGITLKNSTRQRYGESFSTTVSDGKINVSEMTSTTATFDYVVTADGKLIIGSGHEYMSGGASTVQAAGTITINDGNVVGVSNYSGHYQPNAQEAANKINVLKNMGIDLTKAKITTYQPEDIKKMELQGR